MFSYQRSVALLYLPILIIGFTDGFTLFLHGCVGCMITSDVSETTSQEIQGLLHSYFPDVKLNNKAIIEEINAGVILYKPEQILPYLQTVFFEEHLLEMQLDQTTRIFFTNILDDNPALKSGKDEEDALVECDDYEMGSYLKETGTFVLAPLTPRIGNARIRTCKEVVVRFFIGTKAVELGCAFQGQDMLDNTPVLRFDFPKIGRINRNFRPYRVKVVSGVDAQICIQGARSDKTKEKIYQIYDVSNTGMAFQVPKENQEFEIDEKIRFQTHVFGLSDIEIVGIIRHSYIVRGPKEYFTIYGVQFDLKTRSLAEKIEQVAAAIQRLQLREIAERTAYLRGIRLIR